MDFTTKGVIDGFYNNCTAYFMVIKFFLVCLVTGSCLVYYLFLTY